MEEINLEEYQLNRFVCPYCHNQLVRQKQNLHCDICHNDYKITNGIPNFNKKDEYWCNVSREKMHQLNTKALESGDWLTSAKELIPDYLPHIEPFDRADAQYLLPISSSSRILDAGSMWGGVTIPVAQHCKEIFAVDKTVETLTFLKIRANQMGFQNVHVVASPLQNLPFPDDFFDMVILNGVLEWVAFDQEIILEDHWGKKRTDSALYSKDPRKMQVEVLRELNRIIKPGGHIFVAIENSIGYQYLAGFPDDHVNLKYVSFLPRFIANAITKLKLNCEYRTYTYSISGYRSLMKDGGYGEIKLYGAFSHYIAPSEIIPIDLIKNWKEEVLPLNNPLAPGYARIFGKLFPKGLLKHVSPSFLIIGKKDGKSEQEYPRIVQLLKKAQLLKDSEFSNLKIVKFGGRKGNFHSINFLIYDTNEIKPIYFCKICRDEKYSDILKDEARNLSTVNDILSSTDINHRIPKLIYFGTIEGITFEVMNFIEGTRTNFGMHSVFSKRNLNDLDISIREGIEFLVSFQRYTKKNDVEAVSFLTSIIEKQKNILVKKCKLTNGVELSITNLIQEIQSLKGLFIPICSVHGDYDFYCNILFDKNVSKVVDFEHFEPEGLPFLDLATLILNPILINDSFLHSDMDFKSFILKYNVNEYIINWLTLYSELSGIPIKIIKFFAKIAALEQQTKNYPYFRDPSTFPMYNEKIFTQLLSFDIM